MKRRLFLQSLGVAGGAATSGCVSGCVSGLSAPSSAAGLGRGELRDILGRLDRSLAAVAQIDSLADRLTPPELPRTPERLRYLERADPLLRRATRALVLAGARGELPRESPPPAPFMERAVALGPEMDRSVAESLALFERLSPRAERRIGRSLRGKPGYTMDLFERLAPLARGSGVAPSSLWKMRRGAQEVGFRMEKQSASAFRSETSSRVRRLAAHHGLGAVLSRRVATEATTHLLFDLLDSPGGGEPDGPGGIGRPRIPEVEEVRDEHPGEESIHHGEGLLIGGAISFLVFAVVGVFTYGLGAIGSTVGLGLMIGGVVHVINGNDMNAAASE